jgi:putative membrane protein
MGEIEQGKLAQSKAKDAKVKRFAGHLVTDHESANKKGDALVKKLNLTPSANSVSNRLSSDASQSMDSLKGHSGSDFDKSYIDEQIKLHQDVLDIIDNKLLPNAKNAELKSEIQAVRPKIEQHLKEAREIQASLK